MVPNQLVARCIFPNPHGFTTSYKALARNLDTASRVKSKFVSGQTVEGWAVHFTEGTSISAQSQDMHLVHVVKAWLSRRLGFTMPAKSVVMAAFASDLAVGASIIF